MTTRTSDLPQNRRALLPLLASTFFIYLAQQGVAPVLAPISRSVGLSTSQYSILLSVSAVFLILASPLWARVIDHIGSARAIMLGGLGGCVGLGLFASAVAYLQNANDVHSVAKLVVLSAIRGAIFGSSIAGVPIAAQAFAGRAYSDEMARTGAIAAVGSALGLALVCGPGIVGVVGSLSPIGALVTLSLVAGAGAVIAWHWSPKATAYEKENPQPDSKGDAGGDTKGSSFAGARDGAAVLLALCFATYLTTTCLISCLPLLVQDRFSLSDSETVGTAGLLLFLGGLPMLFVQGFIVPRLRFGVVGLILAGTPFVIIAFLIIGLTQNLVLYGVATLVSGIGHSLLIPGVATAISLAAGYDKQAVAASRQSIAMNAALVVGPILFVFLYQRGRGLPFVVAALSLLVALAIYIALAPKISRTSTPTSPVEKS